MNIVLRILVTALALWLTSLIFPSHLEILGGDSFGGRLLAVLIVGAVYALVTMIVRPLVRLVSIPLLILTLGLFTLVINAFMLWITTWLTGTALFDGWGLEVHGGFWWYILIALILSVLQIVISWVVPGKQ